MYGPDGIYYRLGNSILQELKKENDSSQQDNPFRPSSLSGKQNPNKEIYNRMKQEYFKGKKRMKVDHRQSEIQMSESNHLRNHSSIVGRSQIKSNTWNG